MPRRLGRRGIEHGAADVPGGAACLTATPTQGVELSPSGAVSSCGRPREDLVHGTRSPGQSEGRFVAPFAVLWQGSPGAKVP